MSIDVGMELYKECCTIKGDVDIAAVRRLLEGGASVNRVFSYKCETALQAAVQRGATAIVRILLEAGAAVDQANNFVSKPVHWRRNMSSWLI